RAFCKHCGQWTRKLDEAGAREINGHSADDVDAAMAGDWVNRENRVSCPDADSHAPAESVAVRWWREDRWEFVGVLVEVADPDGRVWGESALWSVEAGTFPYMIDRETGEITSKEINPLTDQHHPLPDSISEALGQARDAVAKHHET